jgi:hypothetical protein
MALFCRNKDDKSNKGEAATAPKDVVQGNKGQATIATDDSYDTG